MAKQQPASCHGKVVAITGAARGIGRATAEALVREGAKVAIGDLDLRARRAGGRRSSAAATSPSTLDVTDRESFAAFLDAAEEQLGPLDVLVNNAGIMPRRPPFREEDDATALRHDRHQRPRRDARHQGRPAADARPRPRPRRQHRLDGRARAASRAAPPTAAPSTPSSASREAVRAELREHGDRVLVRDAGRRQHRAGRGPAGDARRQDARARGRGRRHRRRDQAPQARRVRPTRVGRRSARSTYPLPCGAQLAVARANEERARPVSTSTAASARPTRTAPPTASPASSPSGRRGQDGRRRAGRGRLGAAWPGARHASCAAASSRSPAPPAGSAARRRAALGRKGMKVAIGDLDRARRGRPRAELGPAPSRWRSTSPTAPPSPPSSTRPSGSSARSTCWSTTPGSCQLGRFIDEDDATTRRQIDINLHGVITARSSRCARMLPRGRGHIVNIASSGRQGRRPRGSPPTRRPSTPSSA